MTQNCTTTIDELRRTVIDGGYCVGCGVCAAVRDSPLKMELDSFGKYVPVFVNVANGMEMNFEGVVCPFADGMPDEDEIASALFGNLTMHDPIIGYYLACYSGYVTEGDFRSCGSSGGIGSWILCELISQGLVDGVIHVHPTGMSQNDSPLFHYRVSKSVVDVKKGAKSKYYPVEVSEVMDSVRSNPGRYAIVGVPCIIKAIRLLGLHEPVFQKRIRYAVGLVCGHMKTTRFADMFAWQCGISPGHLQAIDFRVKDNHRFASQYSIEVEGISNDGRHIRCVRPNFEFFGYLWGHGLFKNQACDYCDDVFAETADVCVGDAWLPQYFHDWQGANLVIVRNPDLQKLIQNGIQQGRLQLTDMSKEDVFRSQAAGIRHRRDGLAYRLYLKKNGGKWYPRKRVEPKKQTLDRQFRKIHALRPRLSNFSHFAFRQAVQENDFQEFVRKMKPILKKYDALYKPSVFSRLVRRGLQGTKKLLRLVTRD